MKKSFLTIVISIALSAITAFIVTKSQGEDLAQKQNVSPADGSRYRTVSLDNATFPDFTYAAETAVDAVVYVSVAVPVQYVSQNNIFGLFGDIFGVPHSRIPNGGVREQYGSGSGVIIRPDGYIVTNNHVVCDASRIEVTLNNNETYPAILVGTDPVTDVAVIKIQAEGLPAIPFSDSDNLRLGEWVLAIGSPYDLRSTITAGIVSAKGRRMPGYDNRLKVESFIQTDAAVNPGNSGGALVNKEGALVGVNTAIISQTGSYAGYSFAIPSNIVSKISEDLIEFGTVKRVQLGVTVEQIDAKKASELKLSSPRGVYINEVLKGSPAEYAGIRPGDVIVAIGQSHVDSFAQLQESVAKFRPQDVTQITVFRDGQELELTLSFETAVNPK